MMAVKYIDKARLKQWSEAKLSSAGLNSHTASLVADVLVHADSRGVHSHGVMRVEHYCKRIRCGGLNVLAKEIITQISDSVAIVDGDHGMGHSALTTATETAISLAQKTGLGFVSIRNTSHCGALSYYAKMATDRGLIAIAMTQTDSIVAPHGGAKPFFGTNPICFGFPVKEGEPVIVDMATSATAFGKLLHAKETGQPIDKGLALDSEGNETTDPHQVSTLLPFGGYKGTCIAPAIDALTGCLMGARYGNHINRMYDNYDQYRELASLIIVIDPGMLGNEHFSRQMADMVSDLKSAPAAPGAEEVIFPNEPQVRYAAKCLQHGIPVPEAIVNYLQS